jgi:hypothetical protein
MFPCVGFEKKGEIVRAFVPKNICLMFLLPMLAACAAAPDTIPPTYTSPLTYQSFNCTQLYSEMKRVEVALSEANKQQDNARLADTIGVMLISTSIGTLSGQNVAPQISILKGQMTAIDAAMIDKKCPSS